MIDSYEAGKINEALKTFAQSTNNQSISMPAEVLGTDEDGTTWVQVIGGNEKTPLATSTVSLSEGDMVNVTIGNGRAEARGNLTDPSASSTSLGRVEATANEAYQGVGMAVQAGEAAQQAAAEAAEVAEAVNQHFWHRDTQPTGGAGTGAFVTDETQEYFLAHTEGGETPEEGHPLHNLLMNAEGILLRAAKKIRAAFTPSGVAFYDGAWDGQGDGSSHIVAQFGSNGVQLGKPDEFNIAVNSDNLSMNIGDITYYEVEPVESFGYYSVTVHHGIVDIESSFTDSDRDFTLTCNNGLLDNFNIFNRVFYHKGETYNTLRLRNVELIAEDGFTVPDVAKNLIFASPDGYTGFAGFRALVANDIPSLPASKITSGTFDANRIPTLSPSKVGLNRRSETTVANVLTVSSGFTASNVTCLYTDVWAQLRTAIKTNNALTSGTNYSVATIKDAYKPYMGTAGGMYSGTNADVYVDGSAVIHVVPRININADATLYISIPMYFLA